MDVSLPHAMVFFGEIGLSGEVRQVGRTNARLKESEKLGFKRAAIPAKSKTIGLTIDSAPLNHVDGLVHLIRELG
jgi:DNA repair protein RadA/Sms